MDGKAIVDALAKRAIKKAVESAVNLEPDSAVAVGFGRGMASVGDNLLAQLDFLPELIDASTAALNGMQMSETCGYVLDDAAVERVDRILTKIHKRAVQTD